MKRVEFTTEQIEALKEQFSSCCENARINDEFNPWAFFGAVETTLKILNEDGYLYFQRG